MKKKYSICLGLLLVLLWMGLGTSWAQTTVTNSSYDGTHHNITGTYTVSVPTVVVGLSARSTLANSDNYYARITLAGQSVTLTKDNSNYFYNASDPCVFLRGHSKEVSIVLAPGTYNWSAKVKDGDFGYTCYGIIISDYVPGVGISGVGCANLHPDDFYYRMKVGTNDWEYVQARIFGEPLFAAKFIPSPTGDAADPATYKIRLFERDKYNLGPLDEITVQSNNIPIIQVLNNTTCTWQATSFYTGDFETDDTYYCFGRTHPPGGSPSYKCSTCDPAGKLDWRAKQGALGILGSGGGAAVGGVPGAVLGSIIGTMSTTLLKECTDINLNSNFRSGSGSQPVIQPVARVTGMAVYPNPTTGQSTLQLALDQTDQVTVEVLDLQGRTMATPMVGQTVPAGAMELPVDLSSLQAGTYLLRITSAGGMQQTQKIIKE